jgi:VWFA-related protein
MRQLVTTMLVFVCVYGAASRAQAPPPPVPPFRSGVDLVTLHVTVTDSRHHYLRDLSAADFQVFEDGRAQQLAFFQSTGLPLAITLVLDTSGSVGGTLPLVKEAASDFVGALEPGDIGSVIAFDTRIAVLQDFTTDQSALAAAIQRVQAGDSTSLYTAVYIALKELQRATRPAAGQRARREVMVLLSDGDDNSSAVTFDDLLNAVTGSDTAIYTIRLSRAPFHWRGSDTSEFVLRRLSEQTGGRAFSPRSELELPQVYREIRAELASQYALAFVSNDRRRGRGLRQLAVLVSRGGAVARTKRGYLPAGR